MKKLLLIAFALLPSIALAEGVNHPADDLGAPVINNPCMIDNGSGSGVSEDMKLSMRLPTMMVNYAINAIGMGDNNGMAPCPTERKDDLSGKDRPSGFDSDNSTLILGD